MIVRNVAAALALSVFCASSAGAQESMTRGDTFGDWQLLTDSETPHKFCFVTAEPKSSSGASASREAPRAYVSSWPKDGIKGEVSFRMGFAVRKNAEGTASIPPGNYKLFASKDRAYVSDPTQELKLVESMKRGSAMTVTMPGAEGSVTDTYSLNGVGLALQKLQATCF